MNNDAELLQQIVDVKTGEVLTQKELAKNHNFVMLFRNGMDDFMKLCAKDGKAAAILVAMIKQMGENNSLIVSRETLAELLNFSIPTIDRKLKYLRDNNFFCISKSGNMNIYTINSNLAWSTYANNRKYSKFSATVLISESEQEERHKTITKEVNKKITVQ
ncbi:TPA: replication/maintenance protein RepL [Burkholderia cepacia]|uniref:Firmicute plasmid replication protein RepL n=1 Tax=Medicago truncatula TaxID=3880 RepID=A0A072TDL7_MEDTR|nr:replication/maintenance protein RepL [Burkholderia cepacia]KEH15492.1 firmicute plasmid replication protein RepL [Medicago truncatula]HDR9764266.1 replication/maintenance protein RepL [Burkholderia cepacia ATCC 25416]MCA8361183.1 replication/maintenance protein RepL [Burkholderia cepacia]HDR9769805.1 replication/maintenance protein RepL [Burkholderia cepacia ATCC 25416]HDR9778716.1 replication/maintenance protein RepL [Burkholderia cepacia ATCC 25416]